MPPHAQYGFEWGKTTFGAEPRWTQEPSIDALKDIVKDELGQSQACIVTFLAQGGFNKVYKVQHDDAEYIMRVTLPVDPRHKTQSEAATLDFIQQNTDAPVPTVIAFDASNDNALRFEWMLLEHMPGKPLRQHWKSLPLESKRALVKRIALHVVQLFRARIQGIGNLYHSATSRDDAVDQTKFRVGQIVSNEFFWDDRSTQDFPRGPFRSSRSWLHARLLVHRHESKDIIETSRDEDDIDMAEQVAILERRLAALLPSIFKFNLNHEVEETALFHDDLSQQNIMVDEDGNLTAIIDWECVSALPLWRVCQIPYFLRGRERMEMPNRSTYAMDENGLAEDGEINEVYVQHLLQYEQTELRKEFLNEIKNIEPAWFAIYSSDLNLRKADFETAVNYIDDEFCIKLISKWLDDVAAGEDVPSLQKMLLE
ncbi:unnamed protein product [Chondrus crispus]|uniref:Aminoglycoside phosphotransferase domain-containing protein n=1 Tax=Chondrus crispus TaxID=2769 RepID=R7QSB4_CHOCR|nr:unnamed protein product [Chondrus crispus]CDF40406.1 unnamed protein product [Chondrus crispus]|eukprot:XP_005710700.1 unnamed protein product [Chondrus crispus]